MPDGPRDELGILYRIALAVHRAVRDAAGSPHRADVVAMGATGSPTEEIDRLAENEVVRCLDAEGVDWDLVSEEAGVVRRGGRRALVVDPIDGTSNALRQLPFSAVSLALGSGTLDGIDVGLVRDLDRGTTYWATRGGGAYRDGRPIRVRPWRAGAEVVFLNLGTRAATRPTQLAAKARRVRALGSASLELMLVAQGAADAYLFDNRDAGRNLRPTDLAAAYRIVREAGGGMTAADGASVDGLPLGVDRRTSVLAVGDPALARAIGEGRFA